MKNNKEKSKKNQKNKIKGKSGNLYLKLSLVVNYILIIFTPLLLPLNDIWLNQNIVYFFKSYLAIITGVLLWQLTAFFAKSNLTYKSTISKLLLSLFYLIFILLAISTLILLGYIRVVLSKNLFYLFTIYLIFNSLAKFLVIKERFKFYGILMLFLSSYVLSYIGFFILQIPFSLGVGIFCFALACNYSLIYFFLEDKIYFYLLEVGAPVNYEKEKKNIFLSILTSKKFWCSIIFLFLLFLPPILITALFIAHYLPKWYVLPILSLLLAIKIINTVRINQGDVERWIIAKVLSYYSLSFSILLLISRAIYFIY